MKLEKFSFYSRGWPALWCWWWRRRVWGCFSFSQTSFTFIHSSELRYQASGSRCCCIWTTVTSSPWRWWRGTDVPEGFLELIQQGQRHDAAVLHWALQLLALPKQLDASRHPSVLGHVGPADDLQLCKWLLNCAAGHVMTWSGCRYCARQSAECSREDQI